MTIKKKKKKKKENWRPYKVNEPDLKRKLLEMPAFLMGQTDKKKLYLYLPVESTAMMIYAQWRLRMACFVIMDDLYKMCVQFEEKKKGKKK